MAMGMGMAKKMMAQMGHGGSPFEMMQKMMAQMSEAGKPPPMDKMMGMCSEMLNAIRQTAALAVHATPELEQAFGEWLKQLEGRAAELIAHGAQDASELAKGLNITEATANYLLARLAQRGTITLAAKKKL